MCLGYQSQSWLSKAPTSISCERKFCHDRFLLKRQVCLAMVSHKNILYLYFKKIAARWWGKLAGDLAISTCMLLCGATLVFKQLTPSLFPIPHLSWTKVLNKCIYTNFKLQRESRIATSFSCQAPKASSEENPPEQEQSMRHVLEARRWGRAVVSVPHDWQHFTDSAACWGELREVSRSCSPNYIS